MDLGRFLRRRGIREWVLLAPWLGWFYGGTQSPEFEDVSFFPGMLAVPALIMGLVAEKRETVRLRAEL
jgi:hypothetical protein